MAFEFSSALSGARVPQAHDPLATRTREQQPVGGESQGVDIASATFEDSTEPQRSLGEALAYGEVLSGQERAQGFEVDGCGRFPQDGGQGWRRLRKAVCSAEEMPPL